GTLLGPTAADDSGHSTSRPHTSPGARAGLPSHPFRTTLRRCDSGVHDLKKMRPGVRGGQEVSTIGSPSVIAMVCSLWAPREPSALRRVQPSGSVQIASVVARNHGSIAMTRPGRR